MFLCLESIFHKFSYLYDCYGIDKIKPFVLMVKESTLTGFDSNGNPCSFRDEDGYTWIYQGRDRGVDVWDGIPPEH